MRSFAGARELSRADLRAAPVHWPRPSVLDVSIDALEPGLIEVEGLTAPEIGEWAAANGFVLHELAPQQASLEEAFMSMTRDDVEYHATASIPATEKVEAIAA